MVHSTEFMMQTAVQKNTFKKHLSVKIFDLVY